MGDYGDYIDDSEPAGGGNKELDAMFAQEPEPETRNAGGSGKFENVPDGKYQCVIEKVSFQYSKNGLPMLVWVLKVFGDKQRGRKIWKYSIIAPDKIKHVKKDLRAAGYGGAQVTNDNQIMAEIGGNRVDVTAKTNEGGYQNIYINGVLSAPDKEATHNPVKPNPDDMYADVPPPGDNGAPTDDDILLDDDEPF